MTTMRSWFVPVLQFWFGDVDQLGQSDVQHSRRWFMKDEAFDREIAERFGETYADVRAGRREAWLDDPRGRVAYVIVLDQFARNMFRGTARAFEGDRQALAAAVEGVARYDDQALTTSERSFLYMPYMHSEEIDMQERSVALFKELAESAPSELRGAMVAAVQYAEKHRDVIARYGRFPHRNTALGRESTPAELAFIAEPGSGF
jgi:uncharacterized protein (DUF924 family)